MKLDRPPHRLRSPQVEARRQALITRAVSILKSQGMSSRTSIAGIGSDTPYRWHASKNGPELATFLAALDAAGYTLVITAKETVYEQNP